MVEDVSDMIWELFSTPVAMVTSFHDGKPNMMAASWTYNTSLKPMHITVFVDPLRYSHDLIEKSGEFGVNIASDQQADAVHYVGDCSGREIDKFQSKLLKTYKAKEIRAPMIKDCLGNAECRVIAKNKIGDHTAFVGEVLDITYDETKSPLIVYRDKYFKLGELIKK